MVTKIERKNMNFNKIIFMVMIFHVMQITCIDDQKTSVLQAQELFLQEHYQDAFNVYQRIEEKNFVVFYNMGLCCLRQNKKVEAFLFFKRAEKKAESYKELTLIQDVIDFNNGKEHHNTSWYDQFAIFCKKSILSIPILLFQLFILIGLIFLIVCWYKNWYRRYQRWSILCLIAWLILYGIWSYRIDFVQREHAVVMEDVVPVFAGPDSSFHKICNLHQQNLVTIISKYDTYFKIKLDHIVGWVDSQHIELV